ncbi:MAG: cobalamin-dependent protein [Proteobacteria bacterium]|nr:cobalamin-dependent protein [Pseudomonadota bacterium]
MLYLGGYLTKHGKRVKILDYPMEEVIRTKDFFERLPTMLLMIKRQIRADIDALWTNCVGISCYSGEVEEVKQLILTIRQCYAGKIVVGGVHPTLDPECFSGIAKVIIGEGEEELLDEINR